MWLAEAGLGDGGEFLHGVYPPGWFGTKVLERKRLGPDLARFEVPGSRFEVRTVSCEAGGGV